MRVPCLPMLASAVMLVLFVAPIVIQLSGTSVVARFTGSAVTPVRLRPPSTVAERTALQLEADAARFALRLETDLRRRMQPRELQQSRSPNAQAAEDGEGKTRQFYHLHHMKSGGTSVNRLIRCGLNRERTLAQAEFPFGSVTECNPSGFQRCLAGEERCSKMLNDSAVMQFCAPLSAVVSLGWKGVDAVTVLRDPVDRVWSMFRFRMKGAYKCTPLLEHYRAIDNNSSSLSTGAKDQLLDHMTRNMLSSVRSYNATGEDRLAEALENLHYNFAVVGLLHDYPTTTRMIGQVFPWLAEERSGGVNCTLPHANASPQNNRCGANNTHLDVGAHPDDATRAAILAHNTLDTVLYDEALTHFELQKKVLGIAK